MPNTVQVQIQCAHSRSRTYVQRRPRPGYPCRPLFNYKYSVHAHVHATSRPRTTGASLRPPLPNTLHVHVPGARPRTRTHVNRCIDQAAHAKHCTHTRTGRTLYTTRVQRVHRTGYTQKVHSSDGTRRALCKHKHIHFCAESTLLDPYMLNAVHAHTHILTSTGIRLGLHRSTAVHAHINAHTSKDALLGLHMLNAVPYAHPRKIRLTSCSINFHCTLRTGK